MASEVLSTGGGRTLLIAGVLAVVAVVAVAAVLYGYMRPKDSPAVSKAAHEQEVAMPDLKPGVDGGSTGAGLPFALQRQVVFYRTTVVPGSIVIDRESRYLYLIESNNSARRYGIGIARECLGGGNLYRVANKLDWPDGKSASPNANSADALLAAAGRPGESVLGARAPCCSINPGCSSTAPTRRRRSVTSLRPDAFAWSTTTSRIYTGVSPCKPGSSLRQLGDRVERESRHLPSRSLTTIRKTGSSVPVRLEAELSVFILLRNQSWP